MTFPLPSELQPQIVQALSMGDRTFLQLRHDLCPHVPTLSSALKGLEEAQRIRCYVSNQRTGAIAYRLIDLQQKAGE